MLNCSGQLPREIRFDNHRETLKISPHPIYPNFIIQLDVLGRVGIDLAQNVGVLLNNDLHKPSEIPFEQMGNGVVRLHEHQNKDARVSF